MQRDLREQSPTKFTMIQGDFTRFDQPVSGSIWQRQCEALGEERTALCLTIADRNSDRSDAYRVRDTAVAFVGMARSEGRQGMVVNSLLGELIGNHGGPRNAL